MPVSSHVKRSIRVDQGKKIMGFDRTFKMVLWYYEYSNLSLQVILRSLWTWWSEPEEFISSVDQVTADKGVSTLRCYPDPEYCRNEMPCNSSRCKQPCTVKYEIVNRITRWIDTMLCIEMSRGHYFCSHAAPQLHIFPHLQNHTVLQISYPPHDHSWCLELQLRNNFGEMCPIQTSNCIIIQNPYPLL